MTIQEQILLSWILANLALPVWLLWRRSPHFRHRIYQLIVGSIHPSKDREFVHALIETGRQRGSSRV